MAGCGKRTYRTKRYAKQQLRQFRGMGLVGAQGPVHAYFCKACAGWHLGHHGKSSRYAQQKRNRY